MKETFHDELEVGQRERISIDISDIREQIEQCRNDMAWSELPLAAKIRVLVKERLAQMDTQKNQDDLEQ